MSNRSFFVGIHDFVHASPREITRDEFPSEAHVTADWTVVFTVELVDGEYRAVKARWVPPDDPGSIM